MPYQAFKIKWTRTLGGVTTTVANFVYPFPILTGTSGPGNYPTYEALRAAWNPLNGFALTSTTGMICHTSTVRDRLIARGIPVLPDWLTQGDRWYFSESNPEVYMEVTATSTNTIWINYVRNGVVKFNVSASNTTYTNQMMQPKSLPWLRGTSSGAWLFAQADFRYTESTDDHFGYATMSETICYQGSGGSVRATRADFDAWLLGIEPIDTNDPYQDIDNSTPSGPASGDGIPATDGIDIPGLPTVSVVDTGFVTLFNPTLSQVKDLASYMWAGLFDINTFRKIFADPMDCILGFNMLPVSIPDGGQGEVIVGNISTGVLMTKASSQWVEVDCGTLAVPEPYGSYLDWAPYIKISLMLPYIGIVELSTDDVMGRTLALKYHVDVLSCSCVAFLKCGPDTLYQFTGSCGYSIPVTGDNFRQMISNIVSIAATVGGAVASGGITAPAAVAAGASVAQNVMNSKPEIHRSGAIGASAGIMGIQKPFLIMEIPKACKPKKQYHYLGYPSFVTVQLNNISGYAEFDSIILDGVPCTEAERQMILALCKGGVYL